MSRAENPEINHEAPRAPASVVTFPLSLKLFVALAVTAGMVSVLLFTFFSPYTERAFFDRSDHLLDSSRVVMRRLVKEDTTTSRRVLVDLIRHQADVRRRHLADLPLSLYDGDIEKMREAIAERDQEIAERLERNAFLLADEMERRAIERVERDVGTLADYQREQGLAFAKELRRAYEWLTIIAFLLLLVTLGFALTRWIIAPLRRVRAQTREVARGNLDVSITRKSRDEVGALIADFEQMIMELRGSRDSIRLKNEELDRWNQSLNDEVFRKTHHLEEALSELKEAQGRLVRAERMAAVGHMAGGVAHEFNNLIGGIRGCVADLLETEEDPETRESLQVVARAARRATDITEQLVSFSRRGDIQMGRVDPCEIAQEALRLIEPDSRRHHVTVRASLPKGEILRADGDALHKVFLNLFRNAIQAMPDGGTLDVEARTSETHWLLRVQDSGHGISDAAIERVFEPFFTTRDSESDPSRKGIGLGLAVTLKLVEAHGGTLGVASELGQGACFKIEIPRFPEDIREEPGGRDS